MGVQQNIDMISDQLVHAEDFDGRLAVLARLEAEHRDFVADHSEGVALTSAAIAAAIGFRAEEIADIHHAARWHDIGKLAIPEEVLRKPGRLDEAEFAIVRLHGRAGAELLGDEASEIMHDVAAYHHERYDGFGYEGLKGEEIPLAARIVSIADVHDALIQARDYKKGMKEEDALMLMTADVESPGFGRRAFDPFILRRFVAMRLSDPSMECSAERRARLDGFARSNPMEDIPGGPEANDDWLVKPSGHRVRYATAANGNRKVSEMLTPSGTPMMKAKTFTPTPPAPEADFQAPAMRA